MDARQSAIRYSVRLSVPRRGGTRKWQAVSDDFERNLTAAIAEVRPANPIDT
jgi:hypothetical protein